MFRILVVLIGLSTLSCGGIDEDPASAPTTTGDCMGGKLGCSCEMDQDCSWEFVCRQGQCQSIPGTATDGSSSAGSGNSSSGHSTGSGGTESGITESGETGSEASTGSGVTGSGVTGADMDSQSDLDESGETSSASTSEDETEGVDESETGEDSSSTSTSSTSSTGGSDEESESTSSTSSSSSDSSEDESTETEESDDTGDFCQPGDRRCAGTQHIEICSIAGDWKKNPCGSVQICKENENGVDMCMDVCPETTVLIPGGTLIADKMMPPESKSIETLCVDKTEVSVAAYETCIDAGNCTKPGTTENCNYGNSERGRHPINCVSFEQSQAYCNAQGKRLPTEWEWEWAAQGGERNNTYPWGSGPPNCQRAIMEDAEGEGCGKNSTWEVGSRPKGNTPDGLQDMAGNLFEWTDSLFNANIPDEKVRRGGSWQTLAEKKWHFATYAREAQSTKFRYPVVGFRCVTPPQF